MTSLSSIVALYQKYNDGNYVLNDNHDLQFIKLVSDSLNKYYPESPYVKALWAERERLLRQADQLRITSLIDKKAITSFPDIELPNPNGKMIHLNSIKEKCIILNFWSPEDKYCTQVTMGLKSVFDQYKSNKIEIYNIALTANENVWKECIKTLDFPGIQVIDKSQDPLCAKTYNVTALPSSFLIDKQGNIVARDLYGDKLKERIKQILQ
jgi:peroxiredoxin